MNPTSEDRHLGEYLLKELLSENDLTRTWLAEQVSVSRRVLVDELRPDQAERKDAFLADVRAKAAVEHPLIGSVYEAVDEPGICFFAHELLPGATLEQRKKVSAPFRPLRLAHLLRRVSEAHLQHEALGQATSPLGLENIHLDEHGVIRLDNLAIAGPRVPEQSTRDIVHLGKALRALAADGQPGSTRIFTLLGWMQGQGLAAPLKWQQVRDFCTQIEQQLAAPQSATSTRSPLLTHRKPPMAIIAITVAIAVIGTLAYILQTRKVAVVPTPRSTLPNAVLVPAGKHPTPDGTDEELHAFRISAHEVTIGQYATFVETLQTLAKDRRDRTFDHEDQPSAKTSHQPDDWAALLAAAKTNGSWNNRPVTLDSPVVGVDWWDGSAFAEWKQGRLPSQEEWFAALRKDVAQPSAIQAAGWVSVTAETLDRTPTGLTGMAGSVCEWTRRPAPNPANPLGERKWVIIGGSFLKPGTNALTREWTDDRSLRRPDLGFRVVFDAL